MRLHPHAGGQESDGERRSRLLETPAAKGGTPQAGIMGRHHDGRRWQNNARSEFVVITGCHYRSPFSPSLRLSLLPLISTPFSDINNVRAREREKKRIDKNFPSSLSFLAVYETNIVTFGESRCFFVMQQVFPDALFAGT